VTNRAVHSAAVLLIVVIALGSFFVRLVQPVGTNWMNMQLCFFPQYVALFVAGLLIGRTGLATMLPRQAGRTWLRLAFALGVPGWLLLMGLGGALSGNVAAYGGGWSWQSAAFAVWEAFFCVSFSLGLVTLFRERANARTPVTGLLANTSFGIYVFHAPVLVAVSMAIRALTLFPPAKALLVAVIAWALSLAIAWLVRRAPGAGKFFA
jgi:glucans biosynthesis protein C